MIVFELMFFMLFSFFLFFFYNNVVEYVFYFFVVIIIFIRTLYVKNFFLIEFFYLDRAGINLNVLTR
jgi:hypothetical protein